MTNTPCPLPNSAAISFQLKANIDRDHAQLATMLARITASCHISTPSERRCAHCPLDVKETCQNMLIEVAMEFMTFLIDHQRCEDELMAKLPRTKIHQTHCVSHRESHFDFCTRYNRTVLHFHVREQSENIHTLESLITNWIRQHALDFDSRLSLLIEEAHV
jgi:hemerythrin